MTHCRGGADGVTNPQPCTVNVQQPVPPPPMLDPWRPIITADSLLATTSEGSSCLSTADGTDLRKSSDSGRQSKPNPDRWKALLSNFERGLRIPKSGAERQAEFRARKKAEDAKRETYAALSATAAAGNQQLVTNTPPLHTAMSQPSSVVTAIHHLLKYMAKPISTQTPIVQPGKRRRQTGAERAAAYRARKKLKQCQQFIDKVAAEPNAKVLVPDTLTKLGTLLQLAAKEKMSKSSPKSGVSSEEPQLKSEKEESNSSDASDKPGFQSDKIYVNVGNDEYAAVDQSLQHFYTMIDYSECLQLKDPTDETFASSSSAQQEGTLDEDVILVSPSDLLHNGSSSDALEHQNEQGNPLAEKNQNGVQTDIQSVGDDSRDKSFVGGIERSWSASQNYAPVKIASPKTVKREHTFLENEDEPDDDFTVFGKFVASEMRQMRSEERKKRLKRIILRSILDVCEEDDLEYSISVSPINEVPQTQTSGNPREMSTMKPALRLGEVPSKKMKL